MMTRSPLSHSGGTPGFWNLMRCHYTEKKKGSSGSSSSSAISALILKSIRFTCMNISCMSVIYYTLRSDKRGLRAFHSFIKTCSVKKGLRAFPSFIMKCSGKRGLHAFASFTITCSGKRGLRVFPSLLYRALVKGIFVHFPHLL